MNWDEVICKKCGLVNDYTIQEKGGQNCCYCNGCDTFLGNKPKENYDFKSMTMPFGKYKGQYISQINDLNYFNWLLKNVELKGGILAAVKWKLNN